jgi:hypothetical protein
MIAILSPVMAVSCAQLIMMLLDSSRFISALLFAVIVTQIFWYLRLSPLGKVGFSTLCFPGPHWGH